MSFGYSSRAISSDMPSSGVDVDQSALRSAAQLMGSGARQFSGDAVRLPERSGINRRGIDAPACGQQRHFVSVGAQRIGLTKAMPARCFGVIKTGQAQIGFGARQRALVPKGL